MPNTVWVLTEEHNEYDQYGEYFIKVWKEKPNHAELAEHVDFPATYTEQLDWILGGGGRRFGYEQSWYFLREHEC